MAASVFAGRALPCYGMLPTQPPSMHLPPQQPWLLLQLAPLKPHASHIKLIEHFSPRQHEEPPPKHKPPALMHVLAHLPAALHWRPSQQSALI